ncbi:MAG: hypothetical protein KDD35_08295, partial [Bdellovibrionales bacterium]|nr:hypothetical protein [Bdellovibrionales bacterium]
SPSSEAKGKSETLSQTAILYSRTQSQVRVRGPEKPVPAFAPLAQEAETQAPIAAQVETVEVLEGPSYIRVAVPGKAPSDQDRLLVEADLLRTTDASSPLNRATLNGRGVVGSLIGNSEDGEIAISIANPDPSADRASEPKENGEGENAKDSVSPQQNPTKVLEGDDQRVEQLTLFVVKPDSHSSSPTTSVTDSETTVAVSTPVQPKQPTHERGIENSKDSATPSSTGKSPQAKPTVKAKPSPKNQSSSQRNRKSPQTKSLNPSPKAKPATQAKTPPKSSSQPPSKPKKDVKVELVADSAPPPASTAPSTSFPIAYRGLRSPPPPHSPELPIEVESLGLAHIWSSQPQAIIPVDFSDSKLSEAQKMTRQMESLRNDPLIIRYMSYWSGQAKYQQCSRGKSYNMKPRALSFLHKIKALVPHALPIFQALDTTPETMYISALESQYAVTDGWKIETARCPSGRNCSTAAGPYQITETAAKHLRSFPGPGLNFITYALGPNRQVRADDDRSLFLPTTFAFATYAKMLINWFPHHPELWPLGYTEGMGALAKAMKCSLEPTQAARTACIRSSGAGKAFKNRERYRQASLGEIVKFKMAPCDKLDYVLMYLALKFVGSNPIKFGLQIDSAKIPKNLPPLYRPGQNRENLVKTMRKKSQ